MRGVSVNPIGGAFVKEERGEAVRKVRRAPLPFERCGSLSALAREYALFSPALLYLKGRFADERWAELRSDGGSPVVVGYYRLPAPLFAGLVDSRGESHWDRAVFGVPWADWEEAQDLVVAAAQVDLAARWACLYAVQALLVPDQTAQGLLVPGPGVPVHAFAVRATDATWVLAGRPPRLARLAPAADARTYLAAYGRAENPAEAAVRVRARGQAEQAAERAQQLRRRYRV